MKIIKWGAFLLFVFMLCACQTDETDLGGVRVTPQMLESVSISLAEATKTEPTSFSQSMQSETGDGEVVYWTESGTVYHRLRDCSSLKHSAEIFRGSVDEAVAAKKERACKSCS